MIKFFELKTDNGRLDYFVAKDEKALLHDVGDGTKTGIDYVSREEVTEDFVRQLGFHLLGVGIKSVTDGPSLTFYLGVKTAHEEE